MKTEKKQMVIIGGKIFPMEGNNIENGYVRVKGRKIIELGEMSDFHKIDGEVVYKNEDDLICRFFNL